ncbi:MAG TPA: agmatine deiminase family protein [Bacteroidales bacterium]|nr:MAG: Agmatine deiminase [Bacteroidetes bacterium ADurb.Bin217]HPM13722.1 agmatine deiminase family protein [Bacteroidales bacterium]
MISIHFPAEWHTQDLVQLTWPHEQTDFAPVYDRAVACFCTIAREISKRQRLLIVCVNKQTVINQLGDIELDHILFFECESNDVWARDHAAITVYHNNVPVLYDFAFNGWGKKFPAEKDTQITEKLCNSMFFTHAVRHDYSHFVFEGGAIESNGAGVLLTTEACLLSKFRNPHLQKPAIETFLKDIFGAHTVLWLTHGFLQGDDTDSHIDTLARFVDEHTICYVQCLDENDLHYKELRAMELELQSFVSQSGTKYRLVPLPMVTPCYDDEGERLPATYANFLILNNAVLLPVYNCNTDEEAIHIMQQLFPQREIVPIDCSVLIVQHGSLHCVTMQYPKGVL